MSGKRRAPRGDGATSLRNVLGWKVNFERGFEGPAGGGGRPSAAGKWDKSHDINNEWWALRHAKPSSMAGRGKGRSVRALNANQGVPLDQISKETIFHMGSLNKNVQPFILGCRSRQVEFERGAKGKEARVDEMIYTLLIQLNYC